MNEDKLKRFYDALTDLIYEYYCEHREDKATLPDTTIVDLTRKTTIDSLTFFMDTAIKIHGQKLFSIKCGSIKQEKI
jgi:hypothetical protein